MNLVLTRDVEAIGIPDGKPVPLAAGTTVRLTQALGFGYTVETERGAKFRVAGRDGDAIGQPVVGVPAATRASTAEEVTALGRRQLAGVYDPEIPVDILSLGLVHTFKVTPAEGGFHA
ncbi:MAG: iron-sulfur cluster assembly protein, partial [Thermoplasmatota archaeon]